MDFDEVNLLGLFCIIPEVISNSSNSHFQNFSFSLKLILERCLDSELQLWYVENDVNKADLSTIMTR